MNAYIATIPSRRKQLLNTVASLMPQVDAVHIKNGDNELGDANKFYYADQFEGYVFICDDDIIFPEDYVEVMIGKIEEYDRKAAITVGGRTFDQHPIESYYNSSFTKRSTFRTYQEDKPVQVAITAGLAFHSDTIDLSIDDFPEKNMADIWFSIQCEKQDVPRIALAHERDWLTNQDTTVTIYQAYKNNHDKQTEAVNSIEWKAL